MDRDKIVRIQILNISGVSLRHSSIVIEAVSMSTHWTLQLSNTSEKFTLSVRIHNLW